MSNPSTPYGFRAIGLLDGFAPTFGIYRAGQINPANGNSIFYGDVLKPLSGGYFDVFTAAVVGGAPVGGVAAGHVVWPSLAQRMTARQQWWPGTPTDVVASGVVGFGAEVNGQTVFQCRSSGASGGPVTAAQIGSNVNFVYGAGNRLNGLSGFALDDSTIGAGASLPFTIYGLVQAPESDPTSIYNEVLVVFNNLARP